MKERELWKISGLYTIVALIIVSIFWFLFSIQTSFGYSPDGSPLDIKNGSRLNIGTGTDGLFIQPGTGTTANNAEIRIYFGTQSCRGSETVGYILPGTLTGLPFLNYLYNNGSSTIDFNGFGQVTVGGSVISVLGASIASNNGAGTNTTLDNPTFAGIGTITASFGANGLVITPAEYASVNNATGELQAQIDAVEGTISTHAHTGNDGTTQISHNNVTGTGATSHATLDTFYNSKAQASGLASLDANSLVVQNPASGTSTSGTNKIIMSDGTGKVSDGWLSDNVTKLGTPTTDNISEGSTNKYYTDARVNIAVGSLSVNTCSDVNIAMNENDIVKISGGQLIAGSSSVIAAWADLSGNPTDNGSVTANTTANTIVFRDNSGNVFVSGVVGGTTTGALTIPSGTTEQRPETPTAGMIRYNIAITGAGKGSSTICTGGTRTSPQTGTQTNYIEWFDAIAWKTIATGTTYALGSYTVHTFTSSGTFTVLSATVIADVLVIGGGGGGANETEVGGSGAGGGGAGQYSYTTLAVSGATAVVVGAGGAGGATGSYSGASGNSSSFGTITATGGGGGGKLNANGLSGASGGGGADIRPSD